MSDNLVGTKLGNYRLERLLGRGRMGVVYLARDEALLRPTAVKILSWSLPDSEGQNPEAWFIAEARNVARVNHPHVVQIYGVARHGAHCYIAMEYIDGATADVLIEQNGPFSNEQATELLIQTAGALQAAHDASVIHRDIKPENLLVSRDGKAKLGDFGMALHTTSTRALSAGRAGTPYYTAPEIWTGDLASPSSDIYALGATYFYLLTGRPPFVASELPDLIAAHLHAEVPDVAAGANGIAPACQEILRRCMAKSPQRRFASAQAVGWEARAALRRLVSVPPLATPEPIEASQELHLRRTSPALSIAAQEAAKTPNYALDDWRAFYGFVSDPFAPLEPGSLPYAGEPFATLLTQLCNHLNSTSAAVVLLLGPAGIGRTTLTQTFLARQGNFGPMARITCDGLGPTLTVAKKALRAFGMSESEQFGATRDIDHLIEHGLALRATGAAPLLIVDDCDLAEAAIEELAALALAAQLSDGLRLLFVADAAFEARLANLRSLTEGVTWQTMHVPALGTEAVAEYVNGWLRYALQRDATPLMFTPDALLIVADRSQGIALKVNQLVARMLQIAAVKGRRILDSWDAWSAAMQPSMALAMERPTEWPTEEALRVLNRCRRGAGMLPRR